jgi:Ca-activated chloride channel family protein
MESTKRTRDAVLVIDCSGSMQGDSLKLATEGLIMSLDSLQPNERFGIVAFGSTFQQFDKELQPANRKNVDMARRWCRYLGNMGGTEMAGALDMAMSHYDGRAMDILLLTDGQAWNLEDAIGKANKKGVRIFAIGIGSAVAEDTVRTLADKTEGACELVAPTEDMSARILRHFKRMRQPQMTNLDIQWPSKPLWESRPAMAAFAGDAYTVFAAFANAPNEPVAVNFDFASRASSSMQVSLEKAGGIADAIVRAGARQRLEELETAKKQDWAVKHQLITQETDYFIGVERLANAKAEALPVLHAQPQMLAAGWGGSSSVIAKPEWLREAPNLNCSAPSGVDYCLMESPRLMRRPIATDDELLHRRDNGYYEFIEAFTSRIHGKHSATLPGDMAALRKTHLPQTLGCLLEEMINERLDESEIICSFYRALLEHSGHLAFDEKFILNAEAFIGDREPNPELVERFLAVLNDCWRERGRPHISRLSFDQNTTSPLPKLQLRRDAH